MLRIIVVSCIFAVCLAGTSNKVSVEHSIDGEKFSGRGQLVLHSNLRETISKGLVLSDDFDSLAEAFADFDRASSYRIRIPVFRLVSGEIQSGGSFEGHVDSFLPMEFLKAACFAHEIHIYMDQLGVVYGVSILPLTCSNSTATIPIKVFQTESATGPDTKGFIQKVEEERARKARQPVDNRSFFQKYWVYIVVGVFAFTLLSNAGGQGGGEGGQ